MGRSNLTALASQNIVALCDVDFGYVDRKYADLSSQLEQARKQIAELKANPNAPPPAQGPGRAMTPAARLEAAERRAANVEALIAKAGKAKRYQDYRQMLAEQKDIDGVLVATPDHTHAAVAMAAMSLGKHVYVQKPLCWSVHEARALAKKAAETKVATQMGNQGHSLDDARKAIRVHPGRLHRRREGGPHLDQPAAFLLAAGPARARPRRRSSRTSGATRGIAKRLGQRDGRQPAVPQGMAWDLFLGPAPEVPYHPIYHPGQLARLGRLGPGCARRHGRAPGRSPVLGARARHADHDRDRVHAVQRRVLPDGDDDALSSSPRAAASRR